MRAREVRHLFHFLAALAELLEAAMERRQIPAEYDRSIPLRRG